MYTSWQSTKSRAVASKILGIWRLNKEREKKKVCGPHYHQDLYFFNCVSFMIIPCHHKCQFFGSRTVSKIIFKIFWINPTKSESLEADWANSSDERGRDVYNRSASRHLLCCQMLTFRLNLTNNPTRCTNLFKYIYLCLFSTCFGHPSAHHQEKIAVSMRNLYLSLWMGGV